jgi:hypothetical protein
MMWAARMDKLVKRLMSNPAGGYNSTGLPVSLVLNHRSFVQDWETSASDNTCSNVKFFFHSFCQVSLPVYLHRYFHFMFIFRWNIL